MEWASVSSAVSLSSWGPACHRVMISRSVFWAMFLGSLRRLVLFFLPGG